MATTFFPGMLQVTPIKKEGNKMPADVTPDKWYDVVGYNVERRETEEMDGEKRVFDSVSFIIINDRMKPVRMWESAVMVRTVKARSASKTIDRDGE